MTRRDWWLGGAALALLALSIGCASLRVARLYDLDNAEILEATYKSTGSGHGPITISPPGRGACTGEFSTVAGGSTGWGAIFSGGAVTQGVVTSVDNTQRGQAIATCTDGTVFECEYVTSTSSGHGACRDNHQHRYRLMF